MTDLVERLRQKTDCEILAHGLMWEAADEIERLREVVRQGVIMRAAQRAYFADRSRENLIASKEAEKAFDVAARTVLREDKALEDRWDNE